MSEPQIIMHQQVSAKGKLVGPCRLSTLQPWMIPSMCCTLSYPMTIKDDLSSPLEVISQMSEGPNHPDRCGLHIVWGSV